MMDFIDVVSLSHTQSYAMLKGDANSDFSFHDLRKIHHYLKSWYSKFNYNSLNFACCIFLAAGFPMILAF